MDWALIPVFLLLGCMVGFLAGLLGIGGGMIAVPLLTMVFTYERFPLEHVVHMAVATSTATIMFTSVSSVRAHLSHDAVIWSIVWGMSPGLVIGSLVGPQFASAMSTPVLATVFGGFTWFSAVQMLFDRKPAPSRVLPGKLGLSAVGSGVGVASALVGAGGGFLTVPFMTWCNVTIHKAVGTSAAMGLPIALAGTAGYIIAGMRQSGLPELTLGYVYVPALLAVVAASVFVAPLGARTAHSWPVKKLKKAFAFLLFALGGYMFWKAYATWGI